MRGLTGSYSHFKFRSAHRSHCGCCSLHFFFCGGYQRRIIGLVPKVNHLFLTIELSAHVHPRSIGYDFPNLPVQAAFILIESSAPRPRILKRSKLYIPALDLRLGGFGGAFLVYMSIVLGSQYSREHDLSQALRRYKISSQQWERKIEELKKII